MTKAQTECGRSQYDDGMRASSQVRTQYDHPPVGASRQNIFSSVLDAGRNTGMPPPDFQNNNRDTFVQIESPAETMTKAFTPQGLLSAGLQDKQDAPLSVREIARETGASLINVPNKPPPPQTGLLAPFRLMNANENGKAGWAPL